MEIFIAWTDIKKIQQKREKREKRKEKLSNQNQITKNIFEKRQTTGTNHKFYNFSFLFSRFGFIWDGEEGGRGFKRGNKIIQNWNRKKNFRSFQFFFFASSWEWILCWLCSYKSNFKIHQWNLFIFCWYWMGFKLRYFLLQNNFNFLVPIQKVCNWKTKYLWINFLKFT